MEWRDLSVLITGGTGSFGRKFVEVVLKEYRPRRLIIFSRDELKQHEMRQVYDDADDSPVRYFIGDVRDKERLYRAFTGVDIVIHTAALKQISACEYNPFEAIKTNIIGAQNIIEAAIDQGVKKVLALSTDKAVNPVNLYGATKLCAEKLFVHANAYAGTRDTRFAIARYGNVVGSRGSVIPLFAAQRENGILNITDDRMTRFWITLEQGVRFTLRCLELIQGGEIFVPKIPSMSITDLVEAIAPGCKVNHIGIRPGEKLAEVLISENETRYAVDSGDMYVIRPQGNRSSVGMAVPEGFEYTSDRNDQWLGIEELRDLAAADGFVPQKGTACCVDGGDGHSAQNGSDLRPALVWEDSNG